MTNVNKVVINGEVKIDLTGDTVTASTLRSGYTAHDKSGTVITGTMPTVADATSDATVSADEILSGEIAYAAGSKVTGTMPNIGAQNSSISTKSQQVTISKGYHDGSGKVSISSTEQAKIIAGNIKSGVTLLGITGTLTPSSDVTAEAKSATPTFAEQTILPSTGVDYLSQVTIAPIPVTYTANAQGGQTCTVG